MIFRKSYNKPTTRDTVVVTDEGEYPIWDKDFEKLYSSLSAGDEIENPDELIRLAVMRAIKKSAIKKISAGNVTRNALVKKICHENMFGSYPDPSWVEFIVEKLDRAGFINDTMYAKRYIEKALEKHWGEYKIRGSMRERGFKNEDIEKALQELNPDWEKIARDFCEKNEDSEREALYRKLNTRGFPASVIINVLGE